MHGPWKCLMIVLCVECTYSMLTKTKVGVHVCCSKFRKAYKNEMELCIYGMIFLKRGKECHAVGMYKYICKTNMKLWKYI